MSCSYYDPIISKTRNYLHRRNISLGKFFSDSLGDTPSALVSISATQNFDSSCQIYDPFTFIITLTLPIWLEAQLQKKQKWR
jgi:hypothetical protein